MILIRPASLNDLDALQALEALFPSDRLSPRQMRRHILSKTALFLTALHDDAIAGYALFFLRKARGARFYSLIVDPKVRGQGIARRLIEHAVTLLQARGERNVGLEVDAADVETIAFYTRCGFVAGETVHAYYDDGRDALKMRKDLTQ